VNAVERLDAMSEEQAAHESVNRAVGEVLLAIEAATARVDRALSEVPAAAEPWMDARTALERVRTDLDNVRRRLQHDTYFPSHQRRLF